MHYVMERYKLNFRRHRLTFFISFPFFAGIMALLGSLYTGPQLVEAIIKVPAFQMLTGVTNITNPEMLVWFLIFTSIFVLLFPAVGIFYGIKMLPWSEHDGKELIFSTKMSPVIYFIENFILVLILVPLTILPVFLIAILFLGTSSDTINAMAIANTLPIFFVLVVTMVTVFGASIKSSTRYGFAFGGVFYLICFALNLIVSEVGSTSLDISGYHIITLKDISLMSQMNIFQNALLRTWYDNDITLGSVVLYYNSYILTCIVIIIILFLLTIVFLYRTDYIETRGGYSKSTHLGSETKQGFFAKFSFIRTPIESILSKIGWKYPSFRDQLQSSAGFFIIYTIVTTLLVLVVLLAYPGDSNMQTLFTDMVSILDNPLIAGFMFGHTVHPNLEGFILLKLMTFHWLYYGPYLFISTYFVVMRDKNDKYDEITWSMPKLRSSIIISRTGAMILYFWLSLAINYIGLWIGYLILTTYMTASAPNVLATLIAFTFLGLGYSLFLMLFIAISVAVNSKYIIASLIGIFMFAIFIPMVSNILEISWIEYLSPFKYFDVVGLLVDQVNIVSIAIPTIIAGGVIACALYYTSVKLITPRKDLT